MRASWVAIAAFLAFGACAAVAESSRAPNLTDAQAVCRAVAEGRADFLDVAGGYDVGERDGTTALDIDNDGHDEQVAIIYGGSSGTPYIEADGEMIDSGYVDGEEQAFGPWSGQLRLMRRRGRIYEIFYSESTQDFPVYVAIHLPNDESQLLCTFQSAAPLPRLRPTEGHDADAPVCAAVEARLHADASDFVFEDVERRHASTIEVDITGEGAVDFMNDGVSRRLWRAEYLSGAGPGCTAYFYALPDDAPDEGAARALESLQSQGRYGRSPVGLVNRVACHGNTPRFHRIGGSVVFEQRFPGERPQRHDQQFWWVSRVEHGEAVRICEATGFNPQPRTIRYNTALYPQAR